MEYKSWGELNNKFNKEAKPNRKKDKKEKELVNMGRRNALIALGYFASLAALDKALGFFSRDKEEETKKSKKNELEIKKPKYKRSQNMSEMTKPEKLSQENQKRESKEKISSAEKMAQEILRVYNSPALARRFDPKVFTKDFFMAQQFQESRGNFKAESIAGAKGVYQNKPESVIDVVKYLAFLRRHTRNLSVEKHCDYNGPDHISLEKAENISALFLEKADYGRATGKLYLLSIHDKETAFNNPPNPDVFRSVSPLRQQELLLLAYHDGPSCRLHPQKASREAKNYVYLVKKYMERIADLRHRLEQAGMSKDLDYAILKILQELDRKENRHKAEKVITYWLKELQEAHIVKWAGKENFGEPLSNIEIKKLFAQK